MRSLVLKEQSTYPSHVVYQESTSFGDQILTLRIEDSEGNVLEVVERIPEGQWIPFTEDQMINLFNIEVWE